MHDYKVRVIYIPIIMICVYLIHEEISHIAVGESKFIRDLSERFARSFLGCEQLTHKLGLLLCDNQEYLR